VIFTIAASCGNAKEALVTQRIPSRSLEKKALRSVTTVAGILITVKVFACGIAQMVPSVTAGDHCMGTPSADRLVGLAGSIPSSGCSHPPATFAVLRVSRSTGLSTKLVMVAPNH
jgi:hypothetical protein